MVRNGFSLLEIRNLYIDEFFEYYYELVYLKEEAGEMKENSYDKVRGVDRSAEKIDNLFKQMGL